MSSSLGVTIISLAFLLIVYRMLSKRMLREKDALLWFLIIILVFLGQLFPNTITSLSGVLGFGLPANFIFVSSLFILLIMNLQLTRDLVQLEDNSQRISEELAILKSEIQNKEIPKSTKSNE